MADENGPKRVKKVFKFDSVDVHPVEKAIIVVYRVEAVVLSDDGETVAGEKKECQKVIKVQSLNSTTDVQGLAREILNQCKLIPNSRLNEVQQLLSYIQQRPDRTVVSRVRPISQSRTDDMDDLLSQTDELASMGRLDTYMELLYEEVNNKIRGTCLILQLAKNSENLQDLSQNEALIGALYRVLREDGRRHYALAINITFIFFYLATYSTFHPVLTRFKVGSLLMEIISWELQRFTQWETELKMGHTEQAQSEGLYRKIQTALLQQTLLIRTSFYVLLHLSEDPNVEDKMRKKGVIQLLVRTLNRKHQHSSIHELNYLVLSFLQKLSIFEENKDEMAQSVVIERAAVLIDCPQQLVQDAAARVLYNLSFDTSLRLRIGKLGLLPSLMRMMVEDNDGTNIAWALVYQISLDDRGRILISRSECFTFVLEYLLRCKDTTLPNIPLALAVNLSLVEKLAGQVVHAKYFALFLDFAMCNHNAVLVKMLRNATGHRALLPTTGADAMAKIVDAVRRSPDDYFQVEALGLLANIGENFNDWANLMNEKYLVNWLEQHLKPGICPIDVQLSIVLLLLSIARQDEGSVLLTQSDIPVLLIDLLRAQQEDDEFVLQILNVFYRMMRHDECRILILDQKQDVASCFLDLMNDQNPVVRQVCDAGLGLICEIDDKWKERIKNERFSSHNAQWLEAVARTNLFKSTVGDHDNEESTSVMNLCVRHADFLDRASTSASSYGSPESRIGSPIEFLDN